MDDEGHGYWQDYDEDESWLDAENDVFDDDIFEEAEDNEHLVEGGDFHLKSALRGEADMLTNPIYEKEREKLQEDVGDLGVALGHLNVRPFLEKMGERISTDHTNTPLIENIKQGGFGAINIEEHARLIVAEAATVTETMLTSGVDTTLAGAYHFFEQNHPHMKCTVNMVLMFLTILNNVKNIRLNVDLHQILKNNISIKGSTVCMYITVATVAYFSTDIVVFDIDGQKYNTPKTYFLNACDKIQERFNVMLYSYLAEGLSIPGSPPTYIVNRIIDWGDSILYQMGNDGYDVIALYEATVVGVILSRDDKDLSPTSGGGDFLENIQQDLGPVQQNHIRYLIALLHDMTPHQLADLHGLYRIWGHPIIDIDGGVKKLQKVTQSLKGDINSKPESQETVRSFRRLFVMDYFVKHQFYPPITLPEKSNCYIGNCIRTSKKIDESHINYNFSDWDLVELGGAFSIPYSWNVLHLAKDKAISPTRSEMYTMLCKTKRVFNAELRRGVLKLMNTTLTPLREFLTEVAEHGLDIDDCIIGLFPKERELKIMARFFALLSFKMRLYFTATEELLGSKLLRYFPQITMSSNLLDMQEKMSSMSRDLESQNKSVTYVINMDFVKWNQQMRESTCEGVFKELDKLFGLPGLYSRSHQIFRDSILYIADGTRDLTPDPDTGIMVDNNVCWIDDGAGKEGIRQKAWTIMTVCDIAAVARHHPGVFHLVGGGDNQVLTVTYHTNQIDTDGNITEEGKSKIKAKVKKFIEALETHFAARGLPLKTSETWCSTSLFMYNKFMYYKGVPLRSPLKQVSRLFPYSNNTSMTLQSMAQCLGTGLRSAAQKEVSHIALLFMRNIWGSVLGWIILYCHPMLPSISSETCNSGVSTIVRGRKAINMKTHRIDLVALILKILYLPGQLGGPGLVNIYQMTMRGFPDPVTEAICFLRKFKSYLICVGSSYSSHLARMAGVSFSASRSYEPLIEDVCSLNLDTPRSGTGEQREVARKILLKSRLGGNQHLKELLGIMKGPSEGEFYRAISSGKVLDVRVMHEITSSTLYAVTNTFTSRVDKTATLKRLTFKFSMLESLADAELKYIRYLSVRDDKTHDIMFDGCSRIIADECRTKGWGKPVLGVTVPTPFEYLQISWTDEHICDNNHITVRISNQDRQVTTETLGPCKPYLGAYTKEKFKMTEVAAAYGDEDVLSKSLRILKIINWRYQDGSTMSEIIKAPFRAVTDIDPQRMVQESTVTKGDYDHRRKMDARVHGGIPNFVTTPLSHISISTSTWYKHARGGKNENIHFQACIIQTMYQIIIRTMSNIHSQEKLHVHECCQTCICEIQEPNLDLTTPQMIPTFPTLMGNPLVYIPEQSITFDYSRTQEVDYSRRVGSLDCQRSTDYGWVDAYSSLSWLIMCDVIGWTKMPDSFYIMQQERVDHYLLSMYIISVWKVLKSEFDLHKTMLDWGPLLKVYSSDTGVQVLSQSMGIVVLGKLEGGLSVNMMDICNSLTGLTINQIPPFSVNLALPRIHKQVATWWKLTCSDTMYCIQCSNILKGYWEGTSINTRIDNDLRCSECADGSISPRIVNAHISNLSDHLIKIIPDREEVQLPLLAGGEDLNNLEVVLSLEDEWPDSDDITILNKIGEMNDIDGRMKNYLEVMALLNPDVVIIRPEILELEILRRVCEVVRLASEGKLIIHILVEEPSYLESGAIYEMERAFPRHNLFHVQFSFRKPPEGLHKLWLLPQDITLARADVGDWLVIPFTQLLDFHDTITPDTVYTTKEKRLGRCFLVNKGAGGFRPGGLAAYLYQTELSYRLDRSKVDVEINKMMIKDPVMGGKYVILKRRCSWAIFSTKYELLCSAERIKGNLSADGKKITSKDFSRTYKEDIIIFIISVLMRSLDCDEKRVMTLSYVECLPELLTLKPRFNKSGVISVRYLDYFWFFKRVYSYNNPEVAIPYSAVIKGVNLGSPRKEGYSLASSDGAP
ncbi:L protein [rice transitory yellowing virus]|uniref:Replicase n=1 Tax=Rice yellow stunt virus TaxID=59380 RepID=D3KU77_RYSV|nr:L protein [rice transitory yellowing virus]